MSSIICEALTRDFESLRAVDGFTFSVARGEIFGLLGANGAGKTTTVHLLLGLLEPTAGSATVLGLDTRRDAPAIRDRCGALLEHHGLYERLSARRNLLFYADIWRLSDRAKRCNEVLERLGLASRGDELVVTWSRGMKQKLAIARAMLHEPEILFLDEPTAGLDPEAAASLRDQISSLARDRGVTVFLNTHNLADAERLCDSVGIVKKGRMLAIGRPSEVIRGGKETIVEVTGAGLDVLRELQELPDVLTATMVGEKLRVTLARNGRAAAVVRFLVEHGAAVEEVRKLAPSLEDTFLELMQEGG